MRIWIVLIIAMAVLASCWVGPSPHYVKREAFRLNEIVGSSVGALSDGRNNIYLSHSTSPRPIFQVEALVGRSNWVLEASFPSNFDVNPKMVKMGTVDFDVTKSVVILLEVKALRPLGDGRFGVSYGRNHWIDPGNFLRWCQEGAVEENVMNLVEEFGYVATEYSKGEIESLIGGSPILPE